MVEMMKPSWIHTKREVLVVAVETIDTVAKTSLVEKSINTIKFLVIDAVEKVNSGHPGLPMGCALNPFQGLAIFLFDSSDLIRILPSTASQTKATTLGGAMLFQNKFQTGSLLELWLERRE
ncbi:hypothetical protein V6N11_039534 [Hibiscus sabdariffa]|uniref:Transketolase N-terminal domain-containing protein n=1 Tax=Hibiscus sabdariffa TaxID=183260 RepID=A0ABR2SNB7_9ROSI